MAEETRTFVALQLPTPLRAEIEQLLNLLRRDRSRDPVRWVAPANLHLTLRFIGDIALASVAAISTQLQSLATHSPFSLDMGGIGYFPNEQKPQVVWLGLHGRGLAELHRLQQGVDAALKRAGAAPAADTRPFSPHITLGLVDARKVQARELTMLHHRVKALAVEEVASWLVSDLSLMDSTRTPSGPLYSALRTVYLAGS